MRAQFLQTTLWLICIMLQVTPLLAQETKSKKKAQPETTSGVGLGAFGKMLPMGRKNINVEIPMFKEGRPSSLLKAVSMVRVSTDVMQLDQMSLHLYGKSSDGEILVEIPRAEYLMELKILHSNERSRVSRADFQIEGDQMIFDTLTQQGRMTGRVEMVIYNRPNAQKTDSSQTTEAALVTPPLNPAPPTNSPANDQK